MGKASYKWEISYLAVLNGAGVVVPVDRELKKDELVRVLNDADVTCIFCDKSYEKVLKEIREEKSTALKLIISFAAEENSEELLSWTALVDEGKKQIGLGDRQFIDGNIDPDKMSVLLYTAGTTGDSKGVMISHRNLAMNIMAAPTIVDIKPEDIFFSILPIHHTYETTCGLLIPLYKGASVAFGEGAKYAIDNMEEVRPTVLLAVPALAEAFYKKIWIKAKNTGKEKKLHSLVDINHQAKRIGLDLSKSVLKDLLMDFGSVMKMVITGGSPVDAEILQFFNDIGIVTVQGYGLTECGPMVAVNPDVRKEMRMDSVGHLLPGMEVKVIDKDENGIGEICLKGENVMSGYYKNPEATAEVLADGWFHTGDSGFVDADSFIYITGRKKNVILSGGKHVFPEELEYIINRIPYVKESMVWSEETSESPEDVTIVATVVISEEDVEKELGTDYEKAQLEELIWNDIDKINDDLPLYKKIRRVRIRKDDFEKNSAKKIKRFVEENK